MGIRDLAVSRGQTVHNFRRSQLHIMPGLNARDMKSPENVDRVKDLADKIDAKGFTSNVTIFIKDNKPYISQGHCRMAAIDLLISDGKWDEETMLIPALAENSGVGILELYSNQFTSNDSKQLAPREAAFNIMRIMNLLGQDRDRTAAQICRSRSYVDQMLKFNEDASPEVHAAVEAGKISQSQAASILRKEGSKQGSETIKKVVATAEASGKKKATKRDVEAALPKAPSLEPSLPPFCGPEALEKSYVRVLESAIVLARDFLERVGFDFADPATCKEAERIVAELNRALGKPMQMAAE